MTEKSKRKKKLGIRTIDTQEQFNGLTKEERDSFRSIAYNLARPDFKSGLQPDGSVIEI